jgi:HK97 gp10 family phage protein
MSAHFHMDASEVDAYLAEITEDKRATALRTATTAAAKAAVPIMRANTPVGPTGNLRASVQAKAMKKRYGIGSVVGPMTRKTKGTSAQHRHLVEYGTKPHIIAGRNGGFLNIGSRYMRAVDHPGAKPNPFLERSLAAMVTVAGHAFEARMVRYLASPSWTDREPSE